MPNQLGGPYQSGLVRQIFFGQPMTPPTGLYFALTGPTPTNLGYTELNVSNYARVPAGISNGTGVLSWTEFGVGSGAVYNMGQINFAVASAYWGWASGIILVDSAVINGGRMVAYGNISPAKEINTNDQFFIPVSGCLARIS